MEAPMDAKILSRALKLLEHAGEIAAVLLFGAMIYFVLTA
jgi:hypothetical protein